jgi:DmsE family decaheme c-type cytochrome
MRGSVKAPVAALLNIITSQRRWLLFGAALLTLIISLPVPGQQATAPPAAQEAKAEAPAAPTAPAEYVGSEMCQACHEDIFKAFRSNRHFAVEKDTKRGWDGKSCESCHGPGSKHAESAAAEDIINPARQAPKPSELNCLKCHNNQKTNVGRVMGGHGRNEVPCVSCHSVHKAGSEHIVQGRFQRINMQCAGCHQASWAQFQKPYRHRLPENAMSCVDCHNPHGSMLPGSIRMVNANEPGCFKCHGDKRGPFTFEHAPVRMDGCKTCHEPHGSQNPRMLTRHEERFVCLECHSNIGMQGIAQSGTIGNVPPAFHNLLSPRFQRCSTCHVKVHGSNVNRGLTR